MISKRAAWLVAAVVTATQLAPAVSISQVLLVVDAGHGLHSGSPVRFNSGSKVSFATAWGPYVPYWTGKETAKFGCCVARTGNVDGDPQDGCDMSDLSALIDFLYVSLTPPACMAEANCDGSPDGIVDIGDLTALTDFLFVTFTPPAMCP